MYDQDRAAVQTETAMDTAKVSNGSAARSTTATETVSLLGADDPDASDASDASEVPEAAASDVDPEAAKDTAVDDDMDYLDYSSTYSGVLEADPFADQITREMAIGEDDVELLDERNIGRNAPKPQMSKEVAEAKALEKLGPRPEIAPEEDLEGELDKYDARFKSEVEQLMGLKRRGRRGGRGRGRSGRRGRRGGRGRGGGGKGGGQQEKGSDGGGRGRGGGRGGRRKRGGRGRGGGQHGSGKSRSDGGGRKSTPSNAARDGPLSNSRASKGPKGQRQSRRRRPDV